MFKATTAVRPTERVTVTPPRWPWYHAAIFYGVVQVLAFDLSGLVSLARGNRSKSLRETIFPRIAQRGWCRANPDLMNESRAELDARPVRDGRNSRMGSKKAEERKK